MIVRRLAHFEILEPIGKGGMGVVYKARDTHLGRTVAIKVLPAAVASDPERRSRFLREAQAAANLNHPNIATVYQFGPAAVDDPEFASQTGEHEGPTEVLFLAMEYVDGEDLNARMEKGPFPAEQAMELGLQIARGLEAAHRAGVVHRDLKPNNVRISAKGEVKLLDFGLAKVRGPEVRSDSGTFETTRGMVMGTPPYMAPEQLRGTEVDPRSDLFALGTVLFQMLTGDLPYPARNLLEYAKALAAGEPRRLADSRSGITPEQEAVVLRLIAQDPEERYATATEAIADLKAASGYETDVTRVKTGTIPTRGPALGWAERRPVRWIAGAVLGLVLVLVLFLTVPLFEGPAANNLAILPVPNVTGDPDETARARTLTAQIEERLSRTPGLFVISYAETGIYQQRGLTPTEIGAEVGAGILFKGELQAPSRLFVQLIETRRGSVIWTESFGVRPRPDMQEQYWFGEPIDELLRQVQLNLSIWLRGVRLAGADFGQLPAEPLPEGLDTSELRATTRLARVALAEDPANGHALTGLITTLLQEYRETWDDELLAAAAGYAERAEAAPNRTGETGIALARVARFQGDFDEAIRLLDAAREQESGSDRILLERAIALQLAGRLTEAADALREAIRLRPDRWDYWNQLGKVLLHRKEHAQANEALQKAASLNPEDATWVLNNLGVLAIFEGRFADAITVFKSIPPERMDPELAMNLGVAHHRLGNYQAAVDSYQIALDLGSTDSGLFRNLGDAHRRRGDESQARAFYQKAAQRISDEIKRDPKRVDLMIRQSVYRAKLPELCPQATGQAEAILEKYPEEATTLFQLAGVFASCGLTERSLDLLNRSIQLGYRSNYFGQELELDSLTNLERFRQLVKKASLRPNNS